MCWSASASVAMVGLGAAATVITAYRGRPWAVPTALGYFAVMEGLQAAGYFVVDECGSPANQSITLLSYLHIAFQPFIINAFALELVPDGVKRRVAYWVYAACAFSAVVMLMQLYPFEWAGSCQLGASLCGSELCLKSGDWHIAWDIPYNGIMTPFESWLGINASFPTYIVTAFVVPFAFGAWRFVIFHVVAGPVLASALTSNPNEMPAVWCLFSIGILMISLSPWLSNQFSADRWVLWPRAFRE